jgi:ABC-type multidrug transport system fused ATPase/permease subunit
VSDNPRVYNLYGLRVYSEVELPAEIATSDLPPYDLLIRWGERKADPTPAPPEQILATLTLDNGRGYVLADTGSGYNLCFHQTCEIEIALDLQSAIVHLLGEVQPEIAALLLVGNVMACLLTLSGEPVLHASTVEIRDTAIAFVGGSGMGKSTLAALLCANGARFVTDDLLRLQADGKYFR